MYCIEKLLYYFSILAFCERLFCYFRLYFVMFFVIILFSYCFFFLTGVLYWKTVTFFLYIFTLPCDMNEIAAPRKTIYQNLFYRLTSSCVHYMAKLLYSFNIITNGRFIKFVYCEKQRRAEVMRQLSVSIVVTERCVLED